ncbi:unnamed protein product [Clonostachys byssicola]|uniref:Peptidase A1 domain-containing protein n=1 Tax=Clonostachys byssicola TaxID=160290 RepID=A0A9N9XY88_9HYPO|nr:unnamed protein product [Clonostachys byssicola]
MRPTLVLTQLALCASPALAFYPWMPKWLAELESKRGLDDSRPNGVDSLRKFGIKQRGNGITNPTPERLSREVTRLAEKYAGRQADGTDEASLALRTNNYNVMVAKESGKDMTTGIDQDGTDYSYFIGANFGSGGKELYLLLDTGAGSSWVMGTDCTSKACTLHNSFGSKDSSSLTDSGKDFSITYGSGKVKGKIVTDKISVARMNLTYEFGIASETSDDFVNFAFDGILGLSRNNGANQNFLSAIKTSGQIKESIFGVSLHRASDGDNEGEISFGGPDSDKYTGDITYTSTVQGKTDWAIQIDAMSYDGKKAGVGGIPAYIDTGTTYMFGPKDVVQKLHDTIPGSESSDGTSFRVPCDSKDLTFTFSGVDYTVSAKDWVSPQNNAGKCTSNLYGQEVVKGAFLLGASFIKNVYVVFDAEKGQIGLAKKSSEKSGSLSVTSTATSSSATATATNNGNSHATTVSTATQTSSGSEASNTKGADAASAADQPGSSSRFFSNTGLTMAVSAVTLFTLLA